MPRPKPTKTPPPHEPAPDAATPVDVYDYLDYRAYLRDFYHQQKSTRRGFSFRAFSRRAGIASPNHLKRVMEGDRNLTDEMAERFAEACRLNADGRRYFCQLVRFDQARTVSERETAYRAITGFRGYREAHQLDMAHAAYHSTWYIPAIRELAARTDFESDPGWIAARLWPTISVAEATRALHTLEQLGILIRDEHGGLVQANALLTTGPEFPAVHIARYHLMMLERAAASIDLVPSAERDISSVTLLVAEDGVARLKNRLQRFRKELLELSLIEVEPTQVVQVNFQLFPLSRPAHEETKP